MGFASVVWDLVAGGPGQLLELPAGWDDFNNDPYAYISTSGACSYDGRVIGGYWSIDTADNSQTYPCVWVDRALVTLTGPSGNIRDCYIVGMSSDGNIVVGVGYGTDADPRARAYTMVRWTTRTNGAPLTPLAGYDDTHFEYDYYGRMMSADGSVIVGQCTRQSDSRMTNTVWTNGVPADFGIVNPGGTGSTVYMVHVSADGSLVTTGRTSYANVGGFWRGGTFYHLTGQTSYQGISAVYGCNDDGTIIHGRAYDAGGVRRPCYWDSLTTNTGTKPNPFGTGTVPTYGVLHILPAQPGALAEYFAPAANVQVGHLYDGAGLNPFKYVNGVFTNLKPTYNGGWMLGRAMCCNGDGTVIAGEITPPELNGNSTSGYWDAANVEHRLFFPPELGPYTGIGNGYVYCVSYDGTKAFGSADAYITQDPTAMWQIIGAPKGAVGDVWMDPSYVNFSDTAVRSGFINSDNSWRALGDYGGLATGTSPMCFLTCQLSLDPYDIETAYGQDYAQSSWDDTIDGVDPTTGDFYNGLEFDDCVACPPGFNLLPGGTSALGYGVSADGHTTVGQVSNTACYWTNIDGPIVIGPNGSTAWDVSSDGSVIVGTVAGGSFYWTAAGGLVTFAGGAQAISGDGSRIVGTVAGPGPSFTPQQVYWDRATLTVTHLPLPSGCIGGIVYSISDNGLYIVGSLFFASSGERPFRWSAADGMLILGLITGRGEGVADDGTVVGYDTSSGGRQNIFVWTPTAGMTTPFSPDLIWGANGISGDGSTIYAYGWWPDIDTSANDKMAYAVNGVVVTPTPTLHPADENHAGYDINTNAISHDGKVMVGYTGGAFIYCIHDEPPLPVHHLHAADYTFTVSQFKPFIGSAATDTTSDATNLAYLEFGPSGIIEFGGGRITIDIGGGFIFTPVIGFQTSLVTYTVREILADGSVGLSATGTITFIPLTMPLSPGETDEFCACPPCEVLTLCRPRDTFVMRPGRKC